MVLFSKPLPFGEAARWRTLLCFYPHTRIPPVTFSILYADHLFTISQSDKSKRCFWLIQYCHSLAQEAIVQPEKLRYSLAGDRLILT